MEKGERHGGAVGVRPAAVDEQQVREEAEPANGKVGRVHGLAALVARNADAEMRALNHGNVVGAVAHGKAEARAHLGLLDDADNVGLLARRNAAANHRVALGAHTHKLAGQLIRQRMFQRRAVNHQKVCRAHTGYLAQN